MPGRPAGYFGYRDLRQRDLPRFGELVCWCLRLVGRVLRLARRARPTS